MANQEFKKVECREHGQANPAYVCSHSLTSLQDGVRRGLIYVRDEDNHYNGYCNECDAFLMANGDEWNEETEGFAKIQLVCERCFETLIQMNQPS
ncbi:hypothetical protein [Ascidiaceihabitans sp.]|uniref:hypothetical protein n=1 Tax=Ascidiaceihabitans sp. TaxID=1872644 RepID=UPI0032977A23